MNLHLSSSFHTDGGLLCILNDLAERIGPGEWLGHQIPSLHLKKGDPSIAPLWQALGDAWQSTHASLTTKTSSFPTTKSPSSGQKRSKSKTVSQPYLLNTTNPALGQLEKTGSKGLITPPQPIVVLPSQMSL